jgi:hypothetical protein
MKILGLNCQGLNAPTILLLLDLEKQCDPEVMLLSESHLDHYQTDCLRRRLKMDLKTVNGSDGRSGGVVRFWKK